ncbi:Lreu_0056 family protein [Lactobacillus sp. PV037]|uniref:Lreu_0056 family protein n=1 Tax=Lactobacillus sp. PV037 TaxID=2594496 RepID=UPI00223FA608|nr:Abi family protein [Lactobacillus sp. PV037]
MGYYSLINGYKHLFLARDSNGVILNPEQYSLDTNFDEILALYNLDKELRSILYDALLSYETNLGAELLYRFSENFPENYSYLEMNNYSDNKTKAPQILKTISSLSNTLNIKASDKHGDNAIKHYVNRHGHVPLWVLVNFLTFGDLNYFYSNCKDSIKIKIAKDFTNKRKREYSLTRTNSITPNVIENINQIVNQFRNAVAHNEITYSKYLYRSPSIRSISNILEERNLTFKDQVGVFELIICLKLVQSKQVFVTMVRKIVELLDNYQVKFHPVRFEGILQDMHFPQNYREILQRYNNQNNISSKTIGVLVALWKSPDWFKAGVKGGTMYYGDNWKYGDEKTKGYNFITANGDPTSYIYYKINGDNVTVKYVDPQEGETVAEASITSKGVSLNGLISDYYTTKDQQNEVDTYVSELKPYKE